MTLQELKDFLGTLSDDELKQPAVVFDDDGENGKEINHWGISAEDVYWERHGDCLGDLETAKEILGVEWENEKEDLVLVPKGTISLHIL